MTVKGDCFPGIGQERGETKYLECFTWSESFFFFFLSCLVQNKAEHPWDSRAIMGPRTTTGESARKN